MGNPKKTDAAGTKAATADKATTAQRQPYIGMPCLYITAGKNPQGKDFKPRAATVVEVLEDNAVNLQAFYTADTGTELITSVPQLVAEAKASSWDYLPA